MNNIGLTLTADNRAMIRALQDAEKAMASMGKDMGAALAQVEAQAKQTGQALGAMGSGSASRGMQQVTKDMNELGISAKQTAAALRNVPAQFTDIVVSLQGGQAPLTVLLQQGGQLKDMFGGIGPAARALGGYVMGLVNPFTLAAGAAAVLGLAYKQGSDEADAFRKSLLLTGNAAGTTTDQLAGMADSMDETFGVTTGKAAEALNAMAGTGKVARTSLQDFAQVAIDVEKSFGQSIEETAKNFAELGKDPVGASKRLNDSLNFLTAATYAQIKAAADLGETEKAAAIAQDAYAKAMKGRADTVTENLGYIERAYRASLSWAKEAWDAILGIGRSDTTAEKMKDVRKELDLIDQGLRNVSPRQRAALEQQLAALQETEKIAKLAGDRQAERVAAEKAGIKAVDEAAEAAKKNREAREAAAKKAAEEAMRMIADGVKLQQSLTAQDSGLSPEFAKQWDNLGKAYKANKISLEQLLEAQKLLLDQQPFAKQAAKDREDAAKREAKALQDTIKLHEASVKPFEQSLKAQQKRVESLEQEEAAIALSEKMNVSLAQAVEMVNIAKLKEQQIDAMGNEDAVAAIQKEIEEREKLVKLIGSKESRDASAKAAKQAADDWKKASDKIQDSITDALMRGFESGKGFGKNLVDTIKNMFSTLVLRPIIQGVVGTAAGALGLGGSASASAGSLSGIASSAINQYTQNAITTALLTSNAAYGAAIGTTSIGAGSQAAMLAAQTSGFGTAGTLATAQAAGTGSSLLSSAAAAGPYVAAAVLALNALGVFRSKKVVGGGLTGTLGAGDIGSYDLQRRGGTLFNGPSYSIVNQRTSPESKALQDAFAAMRNATSGMAKQLGFAGDSIEKFTTQIGTDLIHPDTGGRGLVLDGLSGEQSAQKIQAALDAANEKMARMALTTTEQVTRQFKFFGHTFTWAVNQVIAPEKWMKAGETAVQALTRLSGSLTGVNTVLGDLNQTLLSSSLAGADAASKLLDVFGGLDKFQAATSAYYQAFYTDAEKNQKVFDAVKKAINSVGLEMPTTLQGFRALVEVQDLNTDAGRNNYAVLMQLAPAFAQATNALAATTGAIVDTAAAAEAAAQAERERAEAVLQERQELQARLDELTLTAAELQERERNALDASNRALFDQIKAVQAQQAAAEAAAQAERERAERLAAIAQERQGLQDRLDQLTMTSAQLLEKERNALDASNRALFDQIQAVEAQKAATEAATQAERERADAMAAAGRTVQEEIRRLRGLNGNTTNQAALQAQFATLTGMARAGDADALAKLPAISQAIEEASRLTAVSALDIARMRTWLSGSLSDTITALGLNVPAFADGGMHAGGIRLVGENGPELEVTGASRIYNAQQTAAMLQGGGNAASEIRAMREELAMLRAEARATAINTGRQADLMKRVTRNGEAMTVQTDLTPLEVTTA